MVATQPIVLSAAQPAFPIQASSLRLRSFQQVVVENAGPGAVIVYAGGGPAGTALQTIGRGQRKLFTTGGINALSFATVQNIAYSGTMNPPLTQAVVLFSDGFGEVAGPDRRDGASVALVPATMPAIVAAIDLGFDLIRGLYWQTGSIQPAGFYLIDDVNQIIVSPSSGAEFLAMSLAVKKIAKTGPPFPIGALLLSDSPFAAGKG